MGAQNERTFLAWLRTALALTLYAAGVGRVLAERMPTFGVAVFVAGAACAPLVLWSAAVRYHRRAEDLGSPHPVAAPVPIRRLATGVTVAGLVAGVAVAVVGVGPAS